MRKKSKMKILIAVISVIALTAGLLSVFSACDKNKTPTVVDYSAVNNFEVSVSSTDDETVFAPQNAIASYGLIFYVGTAIAPEGYTYIGEALARQGYVVVIPKMDWYLAWANYKPVEAAFEEFSNIKFFVGGHSQGGGAAVRRAQEEQDRVAGVILYAPYCYLGHNVIDENGEFKQDEDGNPIYIEETLKDTNLNILLLEAAQDRVLGSIKENVNLILNDKVERHSLSPASHLSFSTMDEDDTLQLFNNDGDGMTQDQKDAQRALVETYTLAFMKKYSV